MVDFSRFVPPARQAPNVDFRALNDLLTQPRREAEDKRRFDEQNSRANASLKLQQDYQSRKFSKEDQAEVEGLMAELQQAQDQGDATVHARALEKLRRYGFDVGKPDLAAFTGAPSGKPAPLSTQSLNLQAFTGETASPDVTGDAIKTELASRAALRARSGQPDVELSQDDFESQLINDTAGSPGRYEADGQTTEEFKKLLPQTPDDEPVDMGDVDSPEFQASAQREVTDLGDVDSPEFRAAAANEAAPLATQGLPSGMKAPEAPGRPVSPRPLSTQMGGNIISKGGKVVATDNGPQGRWQSTVAGAFEPFLQQENPKFADAAKRAQALAGQLVATDGISPKDAIQFAFQRYETEVQGMNNLERTIIGSRPKFGGGAGGTGLLGKTQDIAESVQLYDDNARAEAAKIQEEDRQYESIEAAIASGNPALQRDAVNVLLKVRSGSAVTASEDARISQINGLISQVQDRLGRWSGGAMTPEMVSTIRQIAALKRQVSAAKIKRIYEHQAKLYEAQNQGKTRDPNILKGRAQILREGGNVTGAVDPNADLDQ